MTGWHKLPTINRPQPGRLDYYGDSGMRYYKPSMLVPLNRASPYAQGIVGSWLFNAGSGGIADDSSGYGNNGVLTNMGPEIEWGRGAYGCGLDLFHGSKMHINCGKAEVCNFTTEDFSFRVIFYPTSRTNAASCLLSRGAWGQGGYYLDYHYNGNSLWFPDAAAGWGGCARWTSPPADQWYDLIAVREGDTPRVYINGSEVSYNLQAVLGDTNSSANNLRIGYYNASDTFTGQMALVQVYNRALSLDEARMLYADPYRVYRQSPTLRLFDIPDVGNPYYYHQLNANRQGRF